MEYASGENRITDYFDYEDIEELKPEQMDFIRACVFVESYLTEDDTITLTLGEDGKFFAYLTDCTDMGEVEIDTWVQSVEKYQISVGGL